MFFCIVTCFYVSCLYCFACVQRHFVTLLCTGFSANFGAFEVKIEDSDCYVTGADDFIPSGLFSLEHKDDGSERTDDAKRTPFDHQFARHSNNHKEDNVYQCTQSDKCYYHHW